MKTNMAIKVEPNRIYQGTQVVLRVEPYNENAGDYEFRWDFGRVPEEFVGPGENEAEKIVNTTSLTPGEYRVKVSVKLRHAEEGTEPVTVQKEFNVDLRPVSGDQIDRILERADLIINRLAEPRTGETMATPAALADRQSPVQVDVVMKRRFPDETRTDLNVAFWQSIRNRTNAIAFEPYQKFINSAFCEEDETGKKRVTLKYNGVDAYQLLRVMTEAFLLLNAGVAINVPDEMREAFEREESERLGREVSLDEIRDKLADYLGPQGGLPYLRRIVDALDDQRKIEGNALECLYEKNGQNDLLIFDEGLRHPLLMELIWSYWHEESMLVQAINAVSLRFQNRLNGARDPLANLAIDPLRPLGNVLWGYVQEEYRRLTVNRRAHEYASHYGLKLYGKAITDLQPADTRTQFIEAFHNLLYLTTLFYKQNDDTTVNADPFPLLNGLREVHMILAQGAHNQFGDLPWTARTEMMTQQWIMARNEMNDFLRGRIMVPYEEPWMGAVDTMKNLQGWTDTSVSQFYRLARFGEQLLLSIRYTDWVGINNPEPARNWALYWRAEIQNYIHSYRAATGVDLTADAAMTQPAEQRYRMPSDLLRERLSSNGKNGGRALPQRQDAPQRLPAPAQQPAIPQTNSAPQLKKPQNGNGSSVPAHSNFRERKEQRK